jgi:hypothetical protein
VLTAAYRFLRLLLRVALPAAALSLSACGTSKTPEVTSEGAIREADSAAKRQVSFAAVAAEDYRRHMGSWAGMTKAKLERILPIIKLGATKLSVSASPERYVITATPLVTNHTFKMSRTNRHFFQRTCTPAGAGGCPASGVWRP